MTEIIPQSPDTRGEPDAWGASAPSALSDLKGFVLVVFIVGTCVLLLHTHISMHTGQGLLAVVRDPAVGFRSFDFLGGRANGYTVSVEMTIWSLMGIHCRLAYIIGRMALTAEVRLVQTLTLWFSTALFGWGTTLAVVSTLRFITIGIGDIEIGLHRIEAVVTVSFVLGFYNEEARRMLSMVRDAVRFFMRRA